MKRILSISIFVFCFMPIILACQPSGTNCTTVNGYVGVNVVQAKWNSENEFKGLESVITKPYFNEEQFFASISVENDEKAMLTSMETLEEGNKWDITLTDEEIDLLAKIVWLESRGEEDSGQMATIEVILNRMIHWDFEGSLYDVLSHKNAFSSWGARNKAKPTEKEYDNINAVLNGETDILNFETVYFSTSPMNDKITIQIGGHYFNEYEYRNLEEKNKGVKY